MNTLAVAPAVLRDTAAPLLPLRLSLATIDSLRPSVFSTSRKIPTVQPPPAQPPPVRPSGVSRSAELAGNIARACPELRRPSSGPYSKGDIEVAVAFVVEVSGRVDFTSLRVVDSPGALPSRPEYFPHIYVVGGTARVDRKLDRVKGAYESLVAADVLRHVAALRFQPAMQNGVPVSSSAILIACQAK